MFTQPHRFTRPFAPRTPTLPCLGLFLMALGTGCASDTVVADQVVAKELILTDGAGEPRVFLGVSDEGNGLVVYDKAGKVRAGIGLLKDDTSEVILGDAAGKARCVLTHKDGTSVLALRDEAGKVRVRVQLGPNGPLVELSDKDGNVVAKQP